jgi:hypothetical protein
METQIGSEPVTDREFEHAVARAAYEFNPVDAPEFHRGSADTRPPMIVVRPDQQFGALQLAAVRDCGADVIGVIPLEGETHVHLEWTDR